MELYSQQTTLLELQMLKMQQNNLNNGKKIISMKLTYSVTRTKAGKWKLQPGLVETAHYIIRSESQTGVEEQFAMIKKLDKTTIKEDDNGKG
jgi:hypothetical protein